MDPKQEIRLYRLASLTFATGGMLMAGLWLVYTWVHGPTSYDLNQAVLRRRTWVVLLVIGVFQLSGFAEAVLPLAVTDPLGGYRIYGSLVHLLSGACWVGVGAGFREQPGKTSNPG